MSTHRNIDRILWTVTALTLVLALVFCCGPALGIQAADRVMGYENRLFDTGRVHTIQIFMEDWEGFLQTCTDEQYVTCTLVIDNESYKNVALRAKGNTSLSSVKNYGNDRYSFKVEFDHYDSGVSYHGLDKLCLNNLIQDNTLMKDYLAYQLMGNFGVAAPLCSYAWITVNGEPWGLYLAVEGVEDSFLRRNYGSNHGELYKPDTMGMGGGRGNGKNFDMDAAMEQFSGAEQLPQNPGGDRNFDRTQNGFTGGKGGKGGEGGFGGNMPENMPGSMGGNMPENMPGNMGGKGGMGGMGGMGSSETLLQYTDDRLSGYSNIFSSAKTDLTEADQVRLVETLKTLDSENVADAVDRDAMLRYFVVHNFLVNGDSYTGSIVHNYYLYEENGRLSMLPWDYNLAFGSFQSSSASASVNDPIDTPLSVTGDGRPAIDWIFAGETDTEQYHRYFDAFMSELVESGWLQAEINRVAVLIDPYVQQDPTAFCTYDQFLQGVDALQTWCSLRAQSVRGQLNGTIPTTDQGQQADSSALVDTSGLNQSALGSMGGMGGGRGDMGDRGDAGRIPQQ